MPASLPFVRISVVTNCLLLTVSPMKPIPITESRKICLCQGLQKFSGSVTTDSLTKMFTNSLKEIKKGLDLYKSFKINKLFLLFFFLFLNYL